MIKLSINNTTDSNKATSKITGFSMLELILVITVTSILAYTFISNYTAYVTKTQIANAISVLQSYRKKVEEYYIEHNTFGNNGFNDLTSTTQLDQEQSSINSLDFVTTVRLERITSTTNIAPIITLIARFNNQAAAELRDKEIRLEITLNSDGVFTNTCSSDSITQNLLPKECQNIN